MVPGIVSIHLYSPEYTSHGAYSLEYQYYSSPLDRKTARHSEHVTQPLTCAFVQTCGLRTHGAEKRRRACVYCTGTSRSHLHNRSASQVAAPKGEINKKRFPGVFFLVSARGPNLSSANAHRGEVAQSIGERKAAAACCGQSAMAALGAAQQLLLLAATLAAICAPAARASCKATCGPPTNLITCDEQADRMPPGMVRMPVPTL